MSNSGDQEKGIVETRDKGRETEVSMTEVDRKSLRREEIGRRSEGIRLGSTSTGSC